MLKRIFAIFQARNLEFLRDRGNLAWNLVLPVMLIVGLSFMFSEDRAQYTVGVIVQEHEEINTSLHPFLQTPFIDFVTVPDTDAGMRKVSRHQLDLLLHFSDTTQYWINKNSTKGYFAELALLHADAEQDIGLQRSEISGEAVRYIDWALPGILGMNMMFSCLFGVGYVIVRYRKNGFLKRLRATPLRAIEFVIAQVASRLLLILTITSFVYIGTSQALDTTMEGSYFALIVVMLIGSITLISMGLLVAARVTSEELAGGLLNLVTWPMMMLSGVWFSLEAADASVRTLANLFPLTHILDAARAVMLDGAGLADLAPQLFILVAMSVIFLVLGALTFRWHPQ